MNLMAVLDMTERLYQAMDNPNALEKRCVPGVEVLVKTLRFVEKTRQQMTLASFSQKDCLMLFKLMYSIKAEMSDEDILAHRFTVIQDVPNDEEMEIIFQVFRQAMKDNECEDSILDKDDLSVLCLIYNMLLIQKDKKKYLEKLKSWEG